MTDLYDHSEPGNPGSGDFPGHDGPVTEDHSGRWVTRALVGVGLVLAVLGGVKFADWVGDGLEDNEDDVAADRVGEAIGQSPEETPTEGSAESEGEGSSESEAAETTASTAPATAPDLLRTDAAPALDAFATIHDGAPVQVIGISLYTDYAFMTVPVAGQPGYVDEYAWRGGDGASGPEPGTTTDAAEEQLFDLTEVDASKIPGMATEALAQYSEEGMEVSHIIIDRFLPWDTRVIVRVYVSHPERGGGGYVQFTPDGGFVEKV